MLTELAATNPFDPSAVPQVQLPSHHPRAPAPPPPRPARRIPHVSSARPAACGWLRWHFDRGAPGTWRRTVPILPPMEWAQTDLAAAAATADAHHATNTWTAVQRQCTHSLAAAAAAAAAGRDAVLPAGGGHGAGGRNGAAIRVRTGHGKKTPPHSHCDALRRDLSRAFFSGRFYGPSVVNDSRFVLQTLPQNISAATANPPPTSGARPLAPGNAAS